MRLPVKLSLPAWLLIVGIINLLLIGGVVYYDLKQADAILDKAHQAHLDAMEKELHHALLKTTSILNRNAERIAQWEETLAQFQDPSYYFFWLEHSLPASEFWTPVHVSILLYQNDGSPLVKPKAPDTLKLPVHLPPEGLQTKTAFSHVLADSHLNRMFYQRFVPVFINGQQIGWVGVAYNFLEALRLYYPFQYLNVTQLHVTASGEFPIDKIATLIQIRTPQDTLGEALLDEIHDQAYTYIALLIFIMLLNGGLAWWLYYRPLRQIHHNLAYVQPDQPIQIVPSPIKEIDTLQTTLQEAQKQQQKAIAQLQHSRNELKTLALIDPVTGLHNRTALKIHLEEQRPKTLNEPPLAFVIMDIAHFRALNDTYGPQVGDAVLEEIAHVLFSNETITARYRLGGDEFVLLFSGLSSEALNIQLHALANTIEQLDLSEYDVSFPLHVRFGVVIRADIHQCDLHHCLAEADAALLLAKQNDQTVQFFQESLREQCLLLNTDSLNIIREAVFDGKGLVLYRQPIVKPHTRTILYHELLARVIHEDRLIHPGELFQVIDRRHWHIPFDRQVVAQAQKLLAKREIPEGQGISINLSGQTLMGEDIEALMAPLRPWLATHTIMIEILESYLIDQKGVVRDKLERLRTQGFKVALDDFGSGHASIAYLADLPADTVKLDRSLTLQLNNLESRQARAILGIVHLIHQIGYSIVLEGIEDARFCDPLNGLPVDGLQGFLFARPQPDTVSEDDIQTPCESDQPSSP